ncbi:MAG: hypothetical protein KAV82_02350 [Phycisphaerae bacterium]|nr:hypothetical protein [Phycisphaerae bacterium]
MADLIRDAFNRCKVEEWLEVGDDRYVDLNELGVRGSDHSCIEFLFEAVDMSDAASHLLFSGFLGSGKSTELKILAHRFELSGYNVVFINTEDYLNLRVPANISDIMITIAAGMDRFLAEPSAPGEIRPFRRFWDRFRTFLDNRVSLEKLTVKLPEIAELELAFTKDLDFKTRLYQSLEGRLPELARECREFLDECLGVLASRHTGGTVLIVDSFEKLRGDATNATAVRTSVEEVFVRDWNYLRTPCHAIYTVPPWLTFMEAGAATEFGRIHILPMCKVSNAKTGKPHKKGVQAMMDILDKRMPLDDLFKDRTVLHPLVVASGGYPRDLLRMMRELLQRVRMKKLPLPLPTAQVKPIIAKVLNVIGEIYESPITDEDIDLLVRVAKDRDITGHTRADLHRLADLFDHHFVMSYRNGDRWFDLHPLVRRSEKIKRRLEQPDE